MKVATSIRPPRLWRLLTTKQGKRFCSTGWTNLRSLNQLPLRIQKRKSSCYCLKNTTSLHAQKMLVMFANQSFVATTRLRSMYTIHLLMICSGLTRKHALKNLASWCITLATWMYLKNLLASDSSSKPSSLKQLMLKPTLMSTWAKKLGLLARYLRMWWHSPLPTKIDCSSNGYAAVSTGAIRTTRSYGLWLATIARRARSTLSTRCLTPRP